MIYVFLFYGLAFFGMGLVLMAHALTSVAVLPGRALGGLVAFALLHGAAEWTHLSPDPRLGPALRVAGLVLSALSYLALLELGVELLRSARARWARLGRAAFAFVVIWAAALAVITLGGAADRSWSLHAEIATRYLLGFPAGATAAAGLLAASRAFRREGDLRFSRRLAGAGAVFGVYAVLTGLVAPPASFFPASWLNTETFRAAIHVPVEVLRGTCAVAVGWLLTEGLVVETLRARRALEEQRARDAEALCDKEERLRLAAEAAHVGMWHWDLVKRHIEWTPACKRLFGLDPDVHITAEVFLGALHPDDRARAKQVVDDAIAARGLYRNEYRAVWPDGSVHWLSTLGHVIADASGRPLRLLGATLETTESKRAAEVMAGEARRREEILEAERAARGDAERAARLKDEFLAVLSHELRTPLTSILGWAAVLGGAARSDADVARGLERIEHSARNLAQMVEDLLDVGRIASGKVRLDLQPIDVREVAAEALTSVEASAALKQIEIEAALGDAPIRTCGDPTRVRQIIWNLLSNAVKFTPRGGRVRVTLGSTGDAVTIEVSDTGKGISREFLPNLFERFRQADASYTRRHGGLGLGLAIVKDYTELHGGTVRAESGGEGRGATFTVSLPLRGAAPSIEAARAVPVELAGVRVLVVDDEADTTELVRRILEERKADVVTADSAGAALDAIQELRPDVLVSDIGMPGEDGYQLLRAVRALSPDRGGRTPAAALTAFARPEDRTRALAAGYQIYLTKPIDSRALLAAVATLAAPRAARPDPG
jgi:PAS domain S-box-containing protein